MKWNICSFYFCSSFFFFAFFGLFYSIIIFSIIQNLPLVWYFHHTKQVEGCRICEYLFFIFCPAASKRPLFICLEPKIQNKLVYEGFFSITSKHPAKRTFSMPLTLSVCCFVILLLFSTSMI